MNGVAPATRADSAHDLNNALQSIGAHLNVIGRRLAGCGVEMTCLLQSARDQVEQVASITRSLLEAERGNAGVGLCATVSGMRVELQAPFGEKITLEVKIGTGREPILCDLLGLQDALRQAVLDAGATWSESGRLAAGERRFDRSERSGFGGRSVFGQGPADDRGSGLPAGVDRNANSITDTLADIGYGMDEALSAQAIRAVLEAEASVQGRAARHERRRGDDPFPDDV